MMENSLVSPMVEASVSDQLLQVLNLLPPQLSMLKSVKSSVESRKIELVLLLKQQALLKAQREDPTELHLSRLQKRRMTAMTLGRLPVPLEGLLLVNLHAQAPLLLVEKLLKTLKKRLAVKYIEFLQKIKTF